MEAKKYDLAMVLNLHLVKISPLLASAVNVAGRYQKQIRIQDMIKKKSLMFAAILLIGASMLGSCKSMSVSDRSPVLSSHAQVEAKWIENPKPKQTPTIWPVVILMGLCGAAMWNN